LSSILFLTNVLPYPLDAGAKVRAYHVLQYLAQQHRVTLVSFIRPTDSPEAVKHLSTICERVVTVPIKRSRVSDLRALLQSTLQGTSFLITRDSVAAMRASVAALAQRTSFDAIHADQLSLAEYGLIARDASTPTQKPRLILDLHNAFYLIPQRMAGSSRNLILRAWLGQEAKRVAAYEAQMARTYDRVVTVTHEDRSALTALFTPETPYTSEASAASPVNSGVPSFKVIPICMNTQSYPLPAQVASEPSILFVGGMHWPPNADGVTWFVQDILPKVQAQVPAAIFTAVGKAPPNFTAPNIQLPGYVADADPYWAAARVFIVPLRAGGGMRVKIVDAWARGLPIVSTTIGAEGINYTDGENILIADTPQALAAAVTRILQDSALAARLRANGLQTVRTLYDWRTAYTAWDEVYG
jgi:polysaccharide biosynthesis protein PslH